MKRSHGMMLIALSSIAVAGFGLYLFGKTDLGSLIKGKFDQMNPISRDAMHAMSEEVVMRTAQATNNPKVNQAWVDRQWEALGY